MERRRVLLAVLLLALASGCDVFSTRSPDAPVDEGGTYLQPDTPDQVIENLVFAISELNAQNYRRSFADAFTFDPAASAAARDQSIWTGWSTQDEESYFRALAGAARLTSGNELQLFEPTLSALNERTFTFDASYRLTLNHRRADLSSTLQGRLQWTLEQGDDGLWRITDWTDQEFEGVASWSDLKAAFIKG